MRTVWITGSGRTGWVTPAREMLFKRDRPRAIDRYIDYFGDPDTRAAAHDRVIGDRLETSA